jgi:hypothetical protein
VEESPLFGRRAGLFVNGLLYASNTKVTRDIEQERTKNRVVFAYIAVGIVVAIVTAFVISLLRAY